MEQRPLRLGDIVDDYCPRERRLTNHAIVAIVGQTIRQTRCTTCDADHLYKEGKVPRRKKNDESAVTDLSGGQLVSRPPAATPPRDVAEPRQERTAAPTVSAPNGPPPADPAPAMAVEAALDEPAPEPEDARDSWPMHRRLIRATLPKVEGGEPPPRPIPEFTMHQRPQAGRGGAHGHRPPHAWAGGNGAPRNGFRPERDGNVMPQPGQGPGGGGRRRRSRHKRGR
jgi:hypothetical protein